MNRGREGKRRGRMMRQRGTEREEGGGMKRGRERGGREHRGRWVFNQDHSSGAPPSSRNTHSGVYERSEDKDIINKPTNKAAWPFRFD